MIICSCLPYDEIPQATKDYADFICNVKSLGDVGSLYGVESRRIELHEEMVKAYGLRYEYTRTAVAVIELTIIDAMRAERVAQLIDAQLRYVKNTNPNAREVAK